MEDEMEKMTKSQIPTSFGVFSPTGHVVMAFGNDAEARTARQALIRAGISGDAITHFSAAEVIKQIEISRESENKLFQLGQEEEKVKRYGELANEDCGFLVVYAPSDKDSKRVMDIISPLEPKFAEKYNRLTIEELA
jgi:hypothetical protein